MAFTAVAMAADKERSDESSLEENRYIQNLYTRKENNLKQIALFQIHDDPDSQNDLDSKQMEVVRNQISQADEILNGSEGNENLAVHGAHTVQNIENEMHQGTTSLNVELGQQ